MNWFQAKRYIQYLIKPNHWKGYGIHSPFIFDLVSELTQNKYHYYNFNNIEAWRKSLLKSKEIIKFSDLGAGSKKFKNNSRKVSDIVRYNAIPTKYGRLLFRLVCCYKPQTIIELGTSTGISTLYLGLPSKKTKVLTIEGCSELAKLAQYSFDKFNAKNIKILNEAFDTGLDKALNLLGKVDLVFFDGDHRKESTLNYFHKCLNYASNESIFIFDDIHWSKEMEEAWEEIIRNPQVKISLDLFRFGLIFFRKENSKEHFNIKY